MRISDWSSDVCSSDLGHARELHGRGGAIGRPDNLYFLALVLAHVVHEIKVVAFCELHSAYQSVAIGLGQLLGNAAILDGALVGLARNRFETTTGLHVPDLSHKHEGRGIWKTGDRK